MNRERIDLWCERWILGLVLAILVLTPLAFGGRPQPPAGFVLDFLLLDPFQIAQWLTLGIVVLWGTRLWVQPRPKLLWPPICWAVAAFVAYAIGRYWFADIEYAARQELIRILVYAFLFFAVLNNLHRQESIFIITMTLVCLAMAISCYAIYQFLSGSTRVWHVFSEYKDRASGTYICPNHLGGFLELLLPLGLAYTVAGRVKTLDRIGIAYATLVILAGLAATVSRGAWLASSAALLFFFLALVSHRTYRLPAILLLGLVLGAAVAFMPRNYSFKARYKRLVREGKLDDDLRFFMWEPAYKVWQDNLWWGAGPAHFDYRFRQHRPEAVQLSPDRVHNDFLNVLADWGVVGAVLVSSAFVLLALGVAKTWRYVRGSPDGLGGKRGSNKLAFVLGASAGLIAILCHSMVDFNMHIPANAMLAVALMAMLSSHLRFATEDYWHSARLWSKSLITLLLAIGVIYLGEQSARRGVETRWLARAALAPDYSAVQIDFLKRAYAIEPRNFDTTYAIGEAYRVQSHEGAEDYKDLAAEAMKWFTRGMKLNPWDGYNYLRYGWCLDWVGRQNESAAYFSKAEELDPNGYFTMANIGLHYVDLRDFAAAKPWFQRSLELEYQVNRIARMYLPIVNRKLMEDATNQISAKLSSPTP